MHTIVQRAAAESAESVQREMRQGRGAARPGAHTMGALAERLNQRPAVQAQVQLQRALNAGPRMEPVQRVTEPGNEMTWGGSRVVQRASDSEDEVDADPSRYADFDRAAHNEFLRNPIYQGWVESILAEGPVNVSTSNTDRHAARASWSPLARQILIQERFGPSPQRASMMAFEVTNALQNQRTDALKARAKAGEFEKQSEAGDTLYAREAERSEYDGLTLHHQMMARGINELGWPAELDTYGPRLTEGGAWDTFDKYLVQQEGSGHTNMHRTNYNSWVFG